MTLEHRATLRERERERERDKYKYLGVGRLIVAVYNPSQLFFEIFAIIPKPPQETHDLQFIVVVF